MKLRIRRLIKDRTNYLNRLKRAFSTEKNRCPKVMLISVPKCGTHLAEKVLLHLGLVRSKSHFAFSRSADRVEDDDTILMGITRPVEGSCRSLREDLSKTRRGEYTMGHIPFSTKALALFRELGFKMIVILRDPRDQVISQYHFMDQERHPFHQYFVTTFSDPDQRILACMKGWSTEESGSADNFALSVAKRYELILPWLAEPDCLAIRFEDLIGAKGSGSAESQQATVRAVAEHLSLERSASQITKAARRVFDVSSWTFRSGQIGGWRNDFTTQHIAEFKAVAGPLLIELGYEKNLDW